MEGRVEGHEKETQNCNEEDTQRHRHAKLDQSQQISKKYAKRRRRCAAAVDEVTKRQEGRRGRAEWKTGK